MHSKIPYFFGSVAFLGFILFVLYTQFNTHASLLADAIFLLILTGLVMGTTTFFQKIDQKKFSSLDIFNIVSASMLGAVATYVLTQNFAIPVVISTSLVGLAGYFLSQEIKKSLSTDLAPVIYMGAFVGMSAKNVFPLEFIVIAGLLAGILFIFLGNVFNGCGGKLGSIAFISTVLTIFISTLF